MGDGQGKAVAFLTVFTFVGSVSDKHDRGVELVPGMVPGCWGRTPPPTSIALHSLFQERSKNAELSRNSPIREGKTRELETELSVSPDRIAKLGYARRVLREGMEATDKCALIPFPQVVPGMLTFAFVQLCIRKGT